MPRLPAAVVARMQSSSVAGLRLTAGEITQLTPDERRVAARQAVDVLEDSPALAKLMALVTGETVRPPMSSLRDDPAGRKWLDGTLRLGSGSTPDQMRMLQRALMKIGAHHPRGRSDTSFSLLPWGADGSLGVATLRALDAALKLAGRTDLLPSSARFPLGPDIAKVIESLLAETPRIGAPVNAPVAARKPDVFGAVALSVNSSPYKDRWSGVLSRISAERSRYRDGAPGNSPAVNRWIRDTEALRGRPSMEQLRGVNRIVNAVPYRFDDTDHWASPTEFLNNRGDCEDYVIAKYVSLSRLGVDESRMRVIIVRDTLTRQAHALLAVDMADGTYILDNQSPNVLKQQDVKLPDGRYMYEPIVAMSRDAQWLYGYQR